MAYLKKHRLIILDDDRKFAKYYEKNFPFCFQYLELIKKIAFLILLTAIGIDSIIYANFSDVVSANVSQYFCVLYIIIVIIDYMLSLYIVYKAN
jgi:hypothetical protein